MKMIRTKQAVCILLTAIVTLCSAGCSGIGSEQEAVHPFDFYIDLTTKDDIDGLSRESFVEGVFPFTLMTFQRPGSAGSAAGQLALLVTPSFESLEVSPYAALTNSDPAVMRDPEKHPILICSELAKAERLSVGDVFCQNTNVTEEPLSFTVAGIFRREPLFAEYEAVALINDQITRIFGDIVEEMGYTNAYVKASDPEALQKHLDEDFVPHLQLKGLSEEEIAGIPKEDLKAYYEEYAAHIKRMN